MKADFLSHRQATNRSLLGLVLQLVMGLTLLVYAVYARDAVAVTASWFVLLLSGVWGSLALLYDQHRRERLEAMEAEAFAASDAAASSVFDQSAAELRLAAKRLRAMYRYYAPAAALAIGGLMLAIGLWRFEGVRARFAPEEFARTAPSLYPAAGMAIGVGCAFIGFVFARYIAGMARQKVWENLRAGAAASVGSALAGFALAVGHFVDYAGPDTILRVLLPAVPIAMAVVGAEFLVYLVLELYRPRKPGEHPRPAFDSRLLGFVAAPDLVAKSVGEAVSYQLGQDITSTWGYRLLLRTWRPLALMGVLVAWLMTGLTVIEPHQKGLVLRFGRVAREVGPGIHLKFPWPIDRVDIPVYTTTDERGRVKSSVRTATGLRTLNVGTAPVPGDKPILWIEPHGTEETFFLVRPPPLAGVEDAGAGAARDVAMAAVEVPIHFTVDRDIRAFEALATPDREMRSRYLAAVARREVMLYLSTLSIGEVLSGRRGEIASELRRRIEAAFTRINPGGPDHPVVNVVYVGAEGVHPPQGDVSNLARSYEELVGAEQKYQARLLDAQREAIETLTQAAGSVALANTIVAEIDRLESMTSSGAAEDEVVAQRLRIAELIRGAGGEAAALINKASADRWTKHMGERGRLAAYRGRLESYTAAPAIYRAAIYFDVLRDAIKGARLYICDPIPDLRVRMNMEDKGTGADIFKPTEEGQQNP